MFINVLGDNERVPTINLQPSVPRYNQWPISASKQTPSLSEQPYAERSFSMFCFCFGFLFLGFGVLYIQYLAYSKILA